MKGRHLTIAGISLEAAGGPERWPLHTFSLFEGACASARDHWVMEIRESGMPEIRGSLVFDSGESWAGHSVKEGEFDLVQLTRDAEGLRVPQSLLRIESASRRAVLFDSIGVGLSYPFDELFFLNAFSLNKGLLVHSCSVERHGKGFLFCGVSGAGKSTLGNILKNEGWNVLCDERNAVWESTAEGFQLSSTPWFGGGEICKNQTVPLAGIVMLNPAHEGFSLERLSLESSIGAFMTAVFLPQFSQQGIERGVDTIQSLLLQVPVFQLNYARESVDIASRLGDFSQGYRAVTCSRNTSRSELSLR